MDAHTRVAWTAAAVAVGAVLLACALGARGGAAAARTKEARADALIRASKQWTDAARSDDDAIARLLHAAYGAAYLTAARAVASDEELEATAGVSVVRMRSAAEAQQREAVRALSAALRRLRLDDGDNSISNTNSNSSGKAERMPAYRPR